MTTVIAKLKVRAGQEAAFERAAGTLLAHVKANEPGTLTYAFLRSAADPSIYAFYEAYADQAAFAAHGGSEPMRAFFAQAGELLDGRPEIAMYEEIGVKR